MGGEEAMVGGLQTERGWGGARKAEVKRQCQNLIIPKGKRLTDILSGAPQLHSQTVFLDHSSTI